MDLNSNYQEFSSNSLPTFVASIPPMYPWARRLNQKAKEKYGQGARFKRELAKESGVPYDTVNKCLRGEVENPRGDTMKRLARALGTTEAWFRHGDETMANTPDQPPQSSTAVEIVEVPVFDLEISAGAGTMIDDDPHPVDMQPFRLARLRALTRAPLHALAIGLVFGDSMQPLLFNGDMVLIDSTQKKPRDGVFVLRLGDELMVKRITVGPGRIDVSSDNKAHRSYENVSEADLHIVGRVIWMGRRM